ncbi:hypothetical protein [Bradyrhizobium sp. CCBAU 53415]|uniref:hypothetical protein n=1 Tax=Bradyrhizobium sp. CCBAU 53415 TaxID=1325119 RepID=UPI002305C7B9|nr:hypothetical protein [Bradyrhizobium sp. CCBAU 53415]MDA9465919.1 hypothetical protein [Bradyrhizobium sp. CCBAU 53415]
MLRIAVSLIALSSIWTSAVAQTPPTPAAPPARTAAPAKPAVKKAAPKAKPAAQQPVAAESGPCQIGVIAAIGDRFSVQHVGLTMFGNEYMEAPIETWGIDDLFVAKVRAAASGTAVRKIAYASGAFKAYYHPEAKLFRNDRDDLTALVRQIAGTANCERYVVATKARVSVDGTNQSIEGLGVYKNWASPSGRGVVVAYFRINVFDGRTFNIHRAPTRSFGDVLASSFSNKNDNMQILNNLEFPKTPEQVTNSALLRDSTRSLLTAQLDKYLPAYIKGE